MDLSTLEYKSSHYTNPLTTNCQKWSQRPTIRLQIKKKKRKWKMSNLDPNPPCKITKKQLFKCLVVTC